MKQLLQSLGSGETLLVEAPEPAAGGDQVVIASRRSLVSIGTERGLIEFGRANLLAKARQQPDKVKQVLAKIKTDGLSTTLDAVKSKLDQPIPMGYSNAGVVIDVGPRVYGFQVGDRVVSNGNHAEVVSVPENLVAKIPEGVSFDQAAFTVVGSIGLQGIRLCRPQLGETYCVIGLGLIGLLTVQMLRAHGVKVIGSDFDAGRCARAEAYGAIAVNLAEGGDVVAAALRATQGVGVDGVIITAATKSSEPMEQATSMARKKGKVVLVGVTGLELQRDWFYKKELSFEVSCSYGPGRYEEGYEGKGLDYPLPFVRWTAQRNFQAVLEAIADGKLEVDSLITKRHAFDNALDAYQDIREPLGILLEYPERPAEQPRRQTVELTPKPPAAASKGVLGVIGAGNFTVRTLLPALQPVGARLRTIASAGGVSASQAGRKFGFERATTGTDEVLNDPEIDTVLITTRHGSHASQVVKALKAGKKVFVEKPLAVTRQQLEEVRAAYQEAANPYLMVGFNRRFAPMSQAVRKLCAAQKDVKSVVYTVNAGAIPKDVWIQDPESGGGRIVGEGCHFIDLCRFFVGAPIESIHAVGSKGASDGVDDDKTVIVMRFADGSTGTVLYLANGHPTFPKERVEVFCSGGVVRIDNFRKLEVFGWKGVSPMKGNMDKGHAEEMRQLIETVRAGKPAPIPAEELFEVSEMSILAAEQARR